MIKLMFPWMPPAWQLAPYLERIGETHQYTNNGPLVQELERRLSNEVFDGVPCCVVSNGTSALELALRAKGATSSGESVLVPAMSFRASGLAIESAGAMALLTDVEPTNWTLTAMRALDVLAKHKDFRYVMPVCAFGVALPVATWCDLADNFGIEVIIDAAGAMCAQHPVNHHRVLQCFSLHATKIIGAGEGGVVVGPASMVEDVRRLASFGPGGTNAKMSEYHAAVALASLDNLHAKLREWARVSDLYAEHLPANITRQTAPTTGSTILPVLLPEHYLASAAQLVLASRGIETKQWYRPFLNEPGALKWPYPYETMVVTNTIRDRMLGLPFHHALTTEDVIAVCTALKEICL